MYHTIDLLEKLPEGFQAKRRKILSFQLSPDEDSITIFFGTWTGNIVFA